RHLAAGGSNSHSVPTSSFIAERHRRIDGSSALHVDGGITSGAGEETLVVTWGSRLLLLQRSHRIDVRCACCRNDARGGGGCAEHADGCRVRDRVERRHAKKQGRYQPGKGDGGDQARTRPDDDPG